ncbi:MAG: MATE family efflux transporter, partial [Firmicutes bacterium]|nr:MATE family efflux transporter [Bacillota bacterium]
MSREAVMEKKPLSLTEGNIWKSILFFAMPIMASNLFQQMYNIVDSIIVGRFESSQALAAVSSVTPVINLIITLFLGLTTGAGVVVSIYIGAQNHESTEKSIHTAVVLGLLSGLICTVIGVGLAPFIPGWMNFTE